MHTLTIEVTWSERNYSCGLNNPEIGIVMATGKTLQELKDNFVEALQFQLDGMSEDGDDVPQWAIDGDYALKYSLNAAALIRNAEEYTTMAAISRATGINPKQLSHYANGTKKPRPAQRDRIIEGLHKIGQACMAMC